ncbi:4'-phosphopantetheinyl transferase superfamily protein [Streptomyces sp. NPDC051315]|uniref:4'-phosphopantetheinyl transferase superfamily protein n=1 Tax=Streptomyces sp. NPDC051315 TaxID=3365650 RepID=UPI0037B32084
MSGPCSAVGGPAPYRRADRGDRTLGDARPTDHAPRADGRPLAATATAHEPDVRMLTRLRPLLAAAGLGLGVASVSEPRLAPAGPSEAAAAASMPPRRRLEFLAGRQAARRALRAVGLDCGEIPRSGRLPVFPPGRAASIAHSAGIAVAVARPPGRDTPLGCDLEFRPLPHRAARLVLREDEEDLLVTGARPADTAWSVTELFSAKEAAWKALHRPEAGGRTAGSSGTLRDLRACPSGDGLRISLRAEPARAVRVRVVPLGTGVLSYVLGRS